MLSSVSAAVSAILIKNLHQVKKTIVTKKRSAKDILLACVYQ